MSIPGRLDFAPDTAFDRLLVGCESGDLKAVLRAVPQLSSKSWINKQLEVDIGQSSTRLITPLSVAAEHGHIDISRKLLASGASIRTKDVDPLLIACHNGQLKMVRFLLENGASYVLDDGKSILELAIQVLDRINPRYNHLMSKPNGGIGFLSWLLETEVGDLINNQLSNGRTPLSTAIQLRNEEIVQVFLLYGANCNIVGINDDTPLNCTILNGDLKLVKSLIESNADLNPQSPAHKSAIYTACECGNLIAVELLTKQYHADVNVASEQFESAFTVACRQVDLTVARWLIDNGFADLNKASELTGETPLSICARSGKLKAVKLLVKADAIVDVQRNNSPVGRTALHSAIMGDSKSVVEHLLVSDADLTIEAEQDEVIETKTALIGETELTIKTHKSVSNHIRPLAQAIHAGSLEIVQVFVKLRGQCNIDFDHADQETGYTACHIAASMGFTGILRLLVEQGGVDVNRSTIENDITPLVLAAEGGHMGCLQYLASIPNINMDFTKLNAAGRSPIANARAMGFRRVAKFLEDAISGRAGGVDDIDIEVD